jgi:hypothetical protein
MQALKLNKFYDKKFIETELGIGAFGGIRPNKKENLVAVFFDSHPGKKISDYGRNVYQDHYDEQLGLYFYTGQGQKGDQELMSRGNKWLFDSISNAQIKVLLFRQYQPKGKHKMDVILNPPLLDSNSTLKRFKSKSHLDVGETKDSYNSSERSKGNGKNL